MNLGKLFSLSYLFDRFPGSSFHYMIPCIVLFLVLIVGSFYLESWIRRHPLRSSLKTTLPHVVGRLRAFGIVGFVLLWIRYAEALGINICRQSDIASEEARGFVLTDEYAPFIYINSSDAKVAQLFTLIHELVHLWLNLPGISNLEGIGRSGRTENDRIEIFCNKVASLVLLDEKIFSEEWAKTAKDDSLEKRIEAVAIKAKVSDEVVARRLFDKNMITVEKYADLRRQFQERWLQLKKEVRIRRQDSTGFPSPHLITVLGNGKLFTTAVLDSYSGGFLPSTTAASLLNAKVHNFQKLAAYAGSAEGK